MPVETDPGNIQPLSPYAVRLVKWRVRAVNEPRSRVVMEGLPVCANCHSFSADGRVMGMDLDGLRKNKGRYFLAEAGRDVTVRNQDVIQWTSEQGRLENAIRVGFMSQVSPKGDAVVTTIDTPGATSSNYYVANFTDYRFLQVFFPTRGRLAWYSRASGVLKPLPGADDPAYVHFGAVWSPDGRSLVFARARAQDPNPAGHPVARFANDPNELQIRYDLYRIPFNGGQGGVAEPVEGASNNGMSNTFPKLSPDGRWLVFVQSRNGQLMRPDSQLYIVPAAGGQARRMNCNTALMNSWHSFSPNGRWMVFSSKARSPYTQMYLTHIGDDGMDTPPILIENSTAANRAVNLPEFVNGQAGGLRSIGGPALEYYRLYDRAVFFEKAKRYEEAAGKWRELLEVAPADEEVRRRLGMMLLLAGRRAEASTVLGAGKSGESPLVRAIRLLESGQDAGPVAVSATPNAQEHYYLALVALRRSEKEAAEAHLRQALVLNADYAEAHQSLAENIAIPVEALAHWRETIRLRPNNAQALRGAAWILATNQELRNGPEAVVLAVRALLLTNAENAQVLDTLAAAYAEANRFEDAAATVRRALAAKPADAALLQKRLERYLARQPWRE
ncbi:PD40 domain-containing protein [Paludibaculum fermentans]|uniref:PD40 domain-containing protein n=1 Tax=Paludibaculum fermentans TaxID=1473598 RepID=A0A7S7NS96_PALFE|nr:PD40 domain-containing protein [Paludibaculum fermentans]QOY88895.1 PD40 domain-containing protein [Paludibaculum fermentans]